MFYETYIFLYPLPMPISCNVDNIIGKPIMSTFYIVHHSEVDALCVCFLMAVGY